MTSIAGPSSSEAPPEISFSIILLTGFFFLDFPPSHQGSKVRGCLPVQIVKPIGGRLSVMLGCTSIIELNMMTEILYMQSGEVTSDHRRFLDRFSTAGVSYLEVSTDRTTQPCECLNRRRGASRSSERFKGSLMR